MISYKHLRRSERNGPCKLVSQCSLMGVQYTSGTKKQWREGMVGLGCGVYIYIICKKRVGVDSDS